MFSEVYEFVNLYLEGNMFMYFEISKGVYKLKRYAIYIVNTETFSLYSALILTIGKEVISKEIAIATPTSLSDYTISSWKKSFLIARREHLESLD
jgi:hypothetical protein